MLAPTPTQVARRLEDGWSPERAASQPVEIQVRDGACPGTGPAAGRCGLPAQGERQRRSWRGRYCTRCEAWLFGEVAA
mgnify:CR=1 FL=1